MWDYPKGHKKIHDYKYTKFIVVDPHPDPNVYNTEPVDGKGLMWSINQCEIQALGYTLKEVIPMETKKKGKFKVATYHLEVKLKTLLIILMQPMQKDDLWNSLKMSLLVWEQDLLRTENSLLKFTLFPLL